MKEKLSIVIGAITVFGFLLGGAVKFNTVESKVNVTEQTIQKVAQRLDQKIEGDNYNALRERLWDLQKEYGTNLEKIKDPIIKKEMLDLRDEIELQKEKLKKETP